MYKILIVDDERMIRMGIERTIDWEKLGIDEVYTAASAKEAIHLLEEHRPDVMITDISMTEMTGLELIKTIRDDVPDMRIIILTGYDRFEYAREALQLQVHDFLLKPIDEDVLTESIRTQLQKLEAIREERTRVSTVNRTEGVLQQGYLEAVMRDYIKGKNVEESREEEFFQQFGLEKEQIMRIGLVLPYKKGNADEDEENFYNQTIRQICMSILDEGGEGLTISDGNICIVVFFTEEGNSQYENTADRAEELADILENECNVKPKVILGSQVQGFRNLHISYNDAMLVLENERKEIKDILDSGTESRKNDIFQDIFREFKHAMIAGYSDINQVMHILKRFQMAVESYNLGRKYAINCYFELASAVYFALMNETGNVPEESLNSFTQSMVNIDRDKAKEVTEMFLQKILAKEDGDEHEIIRKVKNIIHEDLSQNLTVANLASQMYVTPNYLSRLFKKITGEGCNEYIVRKRIEKARSLLETTTMKTGEIAIMVGYHDMNYFSLAFKKHIGQSPTKYRNTVQK